MSAAPSLLNRLEKEKTYKAYITDALKLIAENNAKRVQGGYIKSRYIDIVDPMPKETRTSEEIISNIKSKILGLKG